MKYFLDSVLKEDMEKWFPYVEGVTSNPILLGKADITIEDFFKNILSSPDGLNKKAFVQVSTMDHVDKAMDIWNHTMIKKLEGKRTILGPPKGNLIFKVTMHPEFYPLIKEIKSRGVEYPVAATTMYDIVQINQAMELGCDYTMVYNHKNENPKLFSEAYTLKQISGSPIKLVGASFRGKHEVQDAILSGMDYVTANAQSLEETFHNAQLEADFSKLYA